MPIYSDNIRTRLAATPGQYPDSGGRIHPTDYVVHHEVGNLLPKLTEIDHAGGRVDLAKCYLSIETSGQEQGDDCYTYLDERPGDPLVDCLLFRTAGGVARSGHVDERADAQGYVEAYQIKGSLSPWYLRGIHTVGMTSVQLWSSTAASLPAIGDTMYLVEDEGGPAEASQYVQLMDMRYQTELFETQIGNNVVQYSRRIMYCTLTGALQRAFTGDEVAYVAPEERHVNIRSCVVADGSRYYGRSNLIAAAVSGALSVRIASPWGYASPSARGETALASVPALTAGSQTISSGGEDFTVVGPVHTQREAVTVGTRRTIYTRTLLPIPATGGAVQAHVRILGRWYAVVEGASGGVGVLTCNRLNGSATLTLSALPDADTWMLWEWPSAIHYTDRAGTALVEPLAIPITLPSRPEAGSLILTWTSGGVTKTATEASDGTLSGHGTGYRVGLNAVLYLTANLPDGGTEVVYEYDPLETVTETVTPVMAGSVAQFTLADPPRAGTVQVTYTVQRSEIAANQSQVAV